MVHSSALRFSGVGERSDDVVRFVALLLHDGDSKRGEYLLDYRHLRTQLVWHCVAGALVVRIHLVPERRRMQVERHCDAVGASSFISLRNMLRNPVSALVGIPFLFVSTRIP